MFRTSHRVAVARQFRCFVGSWGRVRLSLAALAVGGAGVPTALGQAPPAAMPKLTAAPSPVPAANPGRFQPTQTLPDLTFPPLSQVQAEQPVPAPAPAAPKAPADPRELPAPRPYTEERPRMSRMGSTLGKTPTPTEEDFAEQRQFVQGVQDPRFTLDLIQGRARIIDLKATPTQLQLADEQVAAFTQLNPRQLSIVGRRTGTTVLNMWFADPMDKTKEKIISFLVRVSPDPEVKERIEKAYKALEDEINKAYPNSRVKLSLVGDKLIVGGQAHDVFDANNILRIARYNSPYYAFGRGGAGGYGGGIGTRAVVTGAAEGRPGDPNDPLNPTGTPGLDSYITESGAYVIDHLRVPGVQQVTLRVTVAEVNRAAARSIGVDFSLLNPAGTVRTFGQVTGGLLGTAGIGVAGGLNTVGGSGAVNLPVNLDNGRIPLAINALRSLNYARSLAEPTLTAMNGMTATFLAGGQFPVPVLGSTGTTGTGIGGGAGGNVLSGVGFVNYGVQLAFTPFVTDRDRIRLNLTATVSTKDLNSQAQVSNTNVPGLNARTFTSTVEMREGQTLAVAGLIQNNISGDASRVPFFGDLPLIGKFAGLDRVQAGEQELVVLVTPELAHPLNQNEFSPLPGSDLFEPGDCEFYLLGRLESRRSYDFRSPVMTDLQRQLHYKRMENTYIIGPTGHSEHLLGRPLSATATGR